MKGRGLRRGEGGGEVFETRERLIELREKCGQQAGESNRGSTTHRC